MKATNQSQKGFSIVEVLLVAVVLAIGGALGYVYFNKQASTPQVDTLEAAKTQVASVKTDLSKIKIDETLDTSVIDEALE